MDSETVQKFRQAFAFDDKENLLGSKFRCFLTTLRDVLSNVFVVFSGYLFRLLPIYGRLYVSNNYFCFKSSGPLNAKTKVRISHMYAPPL